MLLSFFPRKLSTSVLLLVVSAWISSHPASAQDDGSVASPTNWVSAQGKALQANFLRLNEDSVVLQLTSTGKEVTVPLASLSLESHLQALKLADPAAFSKPLVKANALPEPEPFVPAVTISSGEILVSPFGTNPSIENFLDTINSEVERGNIFVVWHALPPKMQADAENILTKVLGSVTPQQMIQMRTLFKAVRTIVVDQKEYIFGLPGFAGKKQERDELAKEWPAVEDLAQRVCAEENWQIENFQQGKVIPWLAQMCSHLAPSINHSITEQKAMLGGQLLRYQIISQSADSAEVELTPAGLPFPTKVTFKKFENIWIVPEWMNQMRQGVDVGLKQVEGGVDTAPLGLGLLAANAIVGKLARAESQEEFSEAFKEIEELPGFKEYAKAMQAGPPGGFGGGPGMGAPGMGAPGQGGFGRPDDQFGAPGNGPPSDQPPSLGAPGGSAKGGLTNGPGILDSDK